MLSAVKVWILFSTLLVSSGWTLSALHQLNLIGCVFVFGLASAIFALWRGTPSQPGGNWRQSAYKFCHHFKRFAPFLFLAFALLTLIGGLLYAPSNGSSTAYRIPRVMNWLAVGHWHWIHTLDIRMNIAGCGMEWFFAPLILLTRSDDLLFLPNWFSFLLLPGLIFSVFVRLRISPRVAWWWMWLLPSGWCFIMQAGSTINDSFAAVYALAAVDLALRARKNQNIGDVWLSMLSAALATGVKQSDVLLALPALIALTPNIRLLFKRTVLSSVIMGLCVLVSAFPTIVFNLKNTRNWAGVGGASWGNAELPSPFWGLIGNAFCMTAQNLKPPVFPFSRAWNAAMKHFLETPFGRHFTGFEDFGRLSFGVGESAAALGVGLVFLVLISILAARYHRRKIKTSETAKSPDLLLNLLKWTPWAMLLAFMAKIGTFENGRQFASYYILLFPSLLSSPGQFILVRQRWWKGVALMIMVVAAGLLLISRDRPLFPSQTGVSWLMAKYPDSKFVSNISRTYSEVPAYAEQQMYLRKILPQGESVIGYATWDDGAAGDSLWMPYGVRRVEYVLPDDTSKQLGRDGIHYVVVEGLLLNMTHNTLKQWLDRYHADVVTEWTSLQNPYAPPVRFYLVRLQNAVSPVQETQKPAQ